MIHRTIIGYFSTFKAGFLFSSPGSWLIKAGAKLPCGMMVACPELAYSDLAELSKGTDGGDQRASPLVNK